MLKVPAGVEATCSNGGRLLDFALATKDIAPAVSVEPVYNAPFGTHIGLRVDVARQPMCIMVQKIESVMKPTEDPSNAIISWKEAEGIVKEHPGGPGEHPRGVREDIMVGHHVMMLLFRLGRRSRSALKASGDVSVYISQEY